MGDGFFGMIGDVALRVGQSGAVLKIGRRETPRPAVETTALPELVENYFALDHPLSAICRSFPKDEAMKAARSFCAGLRIIRQPKWECLATFICSSMKQVAHIRQISHALRGRFGELHRIDNHDLYSFPSAQRIAESSDKELRECALGYRAKNLLVTARLVSSGDANLETWAAPF